MGSKVAATPQPHVALRNTGGTDAGPAKGDANMNDLHHGHGHQHGHDHHGHHHHAGPDDHRTVKDPVCGMMVNSERTAHHAEHDGHSFHFCSARCHDKFVAAPEQYLKPEAKPAAPERAGQASPEGRPLHLPDAPGNPSGGAGQLPICGMALEPVGASLEEGPNPELVDMTRRFWIGLVLSVPLLVLEMGSHISALGLHDLVPSRLSIWIQFLLATPVVLWAGWPLLERGWQSFRRRSLNMFSLIALGVGVAYLFSLAATFLPGLFPASFRGMDGVVAVYYEAAAVITVLVLLGQVLELRAREQTGGAIRTLLNLAPKTARRIKDSGEDEEVPLDQVRVGDRLRVRPATGCRSTARCSRGAAPWTS